MLTLSQKGALPNNHEPVIHIKADVDRTMDNEETEYLDNSTSNEATTEHFQPHSEQQQQQQYTGNETIDQPESSVLENIQDVHEQRLIVKSATVPAQVESQETIFHSQRESQESEEAAPLFSQQSQTTSISSSQDYNLLGKQRNQLNAIEENVTEEQEEQIKLRGTGEEFVLPEFLQETVYNAGSIAEPSFTQTTIIPLLQQADEFLEKPSQSHVEQTVNLISALKTALLKTNERANSFKLQSEFLAISSQANSMRIGVEHELVRKELDQLKLKTQYIERTNDRLIHNARLIKKYKHNIISKNMEINRLRDKLRKADKAFDKATDDYNTDLKRLRKELRTFQQKKKKEITNNHGPPPMRSFALQQHQKPQHSSSSSSSPRQTMAEASSSLSNLRNGTLLDTLGLLASQVLTEEEHQLEKHEKQQQLYEQEQQQQVISPQASASHQKLPKISHSNSNSSISSGNNTGMAQQKPKSISPQIPPQLAPIKTSLHQEQNSLPYQQIPPDQQHHSLSIPHQNFQHQKQYGTVGLYNQPVIGIYSNYPQHNTKSNSNSDYSNRAGGNANEQNLQLPPMFSSQSFPH